MISDVDRTILQFEDDHPVPYPAKESDVRDALGMSIVRYHQRLNSLVREQDVVAEFPQLAKRIVKRRYRSTKERESRLLRRHEN